MFCSSYCTALYTQGGVLLGKGGYYGNVFRIKPPMCITVEDADQAAEVLEEAVRKTMQKLGRL